MYLNVCVCDEFLRWQKWQKMKFWTFQAQPAWVGVISSIFWYINVVLEKFQLFYFYFGSKQADMANFENQKFKDTKFVNFTFIINKNGNETSIQPILKSNSTSFMINNIFCEMNIKKFIHWGGLGELS